MALTNAEKQARYRAARPYAKNGEGERRIATWVTSQAAFSLERLARHFGISQRQVLENMIELTTKSVTAKMTEEALDHFYREVTFKPRTRKDMVTEQLSA